MACGCGSPCRDEATCRPQVWRCRTCHAPFPSEADAEECARLDDDPRSDHTD